jgi:hypothetical protein
MTIHYLGVDDEVTTAVARLRTSDEPHVALVLPAGSRVATSRTNFRLLAREAAARNAHLAIVAPETPMRAISIAAGLPAYATVAAYEAALVDELEQEERERRGAPASASPGGRDARCAGGRAGIAGPAASATPESGDVRRDADASVSRPSAGPARADGGSVPGTEPRSAGTLPLAGRVTEGPPRPRRRHWLVVLLLVVLLLAILAGGGGLYLLLPSAQIVVTPVAVVQGPLSLRVTADPAATSVDQTTLVIPAQQVAVPLKVEGTFAATGQKVDRKPATGTVTFTSNDTIDSVTIPAGTTVGTASGVEFLTQTTVVTPRATVNGTTITPGEASSAVQAVAPGPAGNVPAHAVTVVPPRLRAFRVAVDNGALTTGGSRTVTKLVSQQDYAAAVKQLGSQVAAQLATATAHPALAPAGTRVISGTASLGAVTTVPAAAALVGTSSASFQLTATATATAIAVSEQPLAGLAASHLEQAIPAGWSLFPGSVRTTVSHPIVVNGHVTFMVTAQGERWHPLDAWALLAQVKGKSVAEARAILAQYGDVSISTWPSFVTTIPTLEARVSLTVAAPRQPGS